MRLLLFVLFAIIFCLVDVYGRNLHKEDADENIAEDTLKEVRDPTRNQVRHRRPRQSHYDYNYFPDYRREQSRQDEFYSQALRLLDEIASNVRRPPPPSPPSPPIYIPYPVPVYIPQYGNCVKSTSVTQTKNNETIPELPIRIRPEDPNQVWGATGGQDVFDDPDDGARPINFDPIMPSGPTVKPPPVEHGSVQAGLDASTPAPVKRPGPCLAAILSCCDSIDKQVQQTCFTNYGCTKTYSRGLACRPEVVKRALDEFIKSYAPTNEP